jgi:hypothetical protein
MAKLSCVRTRAGIDVSGYGADGQVALAGPRFVIGRASSCDVTITAEIGGRNTLSLTRDDRGWWFSVNNEWAAVRINGREATLRDADHLLCDGDVIEVLDIAAKDVVHVFAFAA